MDRRDEVAEDAAEPTVAELKAHISELQQGIQLLQDENRRLFAELQAYQRREMLSVMERTTP